MVRDAWGYLMGFNTAVTGTMKATGNLTVGDNTFIVTASSGNTAVAGTLKSTSNLTVGDDKFIVTAANGNTAVTGTMSGIYS